MRRDLPVARRTTTPRSSIGTHAIELVRDAVEMPSRPLFVHATPGYERRGTECAQPDLRQDEGRERNGNHRNAAGKGPSR
jgi:hypothetical protein